MFNFASSRRTPIGKIAPLEHVIIVIVILIQYFLPNILHY